MKKQVLALGIISAVSLAGVASALAADGTTTTTDTTTKQRGGHMRMNNTEMETKMAAVKAAIAAGDYTAWVAAEGTNSPFASKITADNFAQFCAMMTAMQSGDTTTAKSIATTLGIELPGKGGDRGSRGEATSDSTDSSSATATDGDEREFGGHGGMNRFEDMTYADLTTKATEKSVDVSDISEADFATYKKVGEALHTKFAKVAPTEEAADAE